MAYNYVACANPKPNGMGVGRLEVLVATRRGCAYVFDWGTSYGGEGRLRAEHSIAPVCFEEKLQKTPRSNRRTEVPAGISPAKLPDAAAPISRNSSDLSFKLEELPEPLELPAASAPTPSPPR